jgi:hypothetical protein
MRDDSERLPPRNDALILVVHLDGRPGDLVGRTGKETDRL